MPAETDFQKVVLFTRALVHDTDPEAYIYTDTTIKMNVRISMPSLSFSCQFDSMNDIFNKVLSESEALEIACRASLVILSGVPEDFSYRTPIMQGRRKQAVIKMIEIVEGILQKLSGGAFSIASFDEIKRLAQDATLFADASAGALE